MIKALVLLLISNAVCCAQQSLRLHFPASPRVFPSTELDPLPSTNITDWANYSGYNDRPTISVYTNLPVVNVVALNNAISNCWKLGSNGIVYLTNGTYVLDDTLKMRPGVNLWGSAGTNSILILTNAIWLGNDGTSGNWTTNGIHSGAWKGSSNISLVATPSITVGMPIVITATNDWSFVHPFGYELGSALGWDGDDPDPESNNAYVRGQVSRITAISNSTNITIWPPLTADFTNTPARICYRADTFGDVLPQVGYASIANMAIVQPTTSEAMYLRGSYNNFISNVTFRIPDQGLENYSAVQMQYAVNITVEHCYFDGTAGSGRASAVNVRENSSGIRVQNNIGVECYQFIVTISRGANNAFAYNYSHNPTNYTTSQIAEYISHGAHKYLQLWEGNFGGLLRFDNTHGSSSSQTALRNYMLGQMPWTTYGFSSFANDSWNYHSQWVGNVGGYSGMTGYSYEQESPTTFDKAIFSWGYHGFATTPTTGTLSKATAIIHGNVTFESGSAVTNWASGYSRTLTNSLLFASRPSWYGTNLNWPPYGPDVTNFTNMIPAQIRFRYGTNSF